MVERGRGALATPRGAGQEEGRHSRLLGAVAAVVDGGRDAHHQGREAVAAHVVVLGAGVLALEHLHQQQVQVHALQAEPGEGSQEEVVQQASKDGAGDLGGSPGAQVSGRPGPCPGRPWPGRPLPQPTSYCVLSIPTRKSSSAKKRLMQRFLWMVLRSVCSPRRKQKVEMQMARHTSEITMPTHVMTDSSSSLMRPWYWGTGAGARSGLWLRGHGAPSPGTTRVTPARFSRGPDPTRTREDQGETGGGRAVFPGTTPL